jgi:hypothetical protein
MSLRFASDQRVPQRRREVGRDGLWHWRKRGQIEAAKARDAGRPGEN